MAITKVQEALHRTAPRTKERSPEEAKVAAAKGGAGGEWAGVPRCDDSAGRGELKGVVGGAG